MTNQCPQYLAGIASVNQKNSYTGKLLENLKKRKVNSSLKDTILGGDQADIQLVSKYDTRFWFLFCVIDIYSKGVKSPSAFQKV